MTNSIIDGKAHSFALQIILLYKQLISEKKEFVLSKQILRSGTAISSLIWESKHCQNKKDFLNKINVALKEANETKNWLQLLRDREYITSSNFEIIYPSIDELIRILATIVNTTKRNLLA